MAPPDPARATGGDALPADGFWDVFIDRLPIDGASVTVVGMNGNRSVISSSGSVATALERLQYALREGPHWEALGTKEPVLIGDTWTTDPDRWPMFSAEVQVVDVRAMFSLPLTVGAAVVGVADLHRRRPGALSADDLRRALVLARSMSGRAVRAAITAAEGDHPAMGGSAPEMRREVHQATGMLAVQLDTTATNAFAVLSAYAFARDRDVDDVAFDIVQRRVDLVGFSGE